MSDDFMGTNGKAVQIIRIENGNFKINENELMKILYHPNAKNKPVKT